MYENIVYDPARNRFYFWRTSYHPNVSGATAVSMESVGARAGESRFIQGIIEQDGLGVADYLFGPGDCNCPVRAKVRQALSLLVNA